LYVLVIRSKSDGARRLLSEITGTRFDLHTYQRTERVVALRDFNLRIDAIVMK
jgi:hypothetical protein